MTLMSNAAANSRSRRLLRGGSLRGSRRSNFSIEKIVAVSVIVFGALIASEQARSVPVFDASGAAVNGESARLRAASVGHLIHRLKFAGVDTRLAEVNRFFNSFEYGSDVDLWGRWDYWADPDEFIERGAGDCEDFAISKYFVLRALGVEDKHLRIAYVRDLRVDDWHMVLLYSPSSGSDPLVLDARSSDIRPLSRRRELVPVYGFNATDVTVLGRFREIQTAGSAASSGHREWKRVLATAGIPSKPILKTGRTFREPAHPGLH